MTDEHADPESLDEWLASTFGGSPEDYRCDWDTAAEKLQQGELDDRIDQIDDPDKHYTSEEVAEEFGITLDDSDPGTDTADDC